MPAKNQELVIDGRPVPISNPEKVLYPAARFTKARVIDYYIRVSDYILPQIRNRPVTLKRFPNGVGGKFFYEKNAPAFTPTWIKTFDVPRRTGGTPIRYVLLNDHPSLVWSANVANLEIHPFLHRVPRIDQPTAVVFDLDPGEGADVISCARVALLLRELFGRLNLECFVKVSGSKGMQLYVPLNTPVTYDVTRPFAQSVAQRMEQEHPDQVISSMTKSKRTGKVFIDWSQNSDFKTTVCAYSLRAKRPRPYVSMPLDWSELETLLKSQDPARFDFEPEAALERLEKRGDLFAPVLRLKQKLPADTTALAPKAKGKALDTGRRKRDFSKTPEPPPLVRRAGAQGSRRR